ncbi:MAG TPA: hypothetical protein VGS19_23640 [Streptosporangiaceae bacterium]|nr:hypothetical protein [Streptosporangiaceae bacterium]
MKASMAKQVADVVLRAWTPQHATVRFVRQVAPTVEDLTARRTQATLQAGDYPTGAWGTESRDYHVCVDAEPAEIGREMLAARVSLVASTASGPQILGQGLSGRSGPTTRHCPRGSTATSPITPARPSSPRPSRMGSRPTGQVTLTPRPPS